jgi:hypothetical protein
MGLKRDPHNVLKKVLWGFQHTDTVTGLSLQQAQMRHNDSNNFQCASKNAKDNLLNLFGFVRDGRVSDGI